MAPAAGCGEGHVRYCVAEHATLPAWPRRQATPVSPGVSGAQLFGSRWAKRPNLAPRVPFLRS